MLRRKPCVCGSKDFEVYRQDFHTTVLCNKCSKHAVWEPDPKYPIAAYLESCGFDLRCYIENDDEFENVDMDFASKWILYRKTRIDDAYGENYGNSKLKVFETKSDMFKYIRYKSEIDYMSIFHGGKEIEVKTQIVIDGEIV